MHRCMFSGFSLEKETRSSKQAFVRSLEEPSQAEPSQATDQEWMKKKNQSHFRKAIRWLVG